jgi:hypothetical protein
MTIMATLVPALRNRPIDVPTPARAKHGRRVRSATRFTLSTIGAVVALAGIEHGVGEILQGNVAPASTVIESWPRSDAFWILAGEPAMTVVPNLLATGILAILSSVAFLIWVTAFISRRHGGLVLIVLSMAMLLVGAGFGPPLIGVVLGVAATRINAPPQWSTQLPRGADRLLATWWPGLLGADLCAWLSVFPGVVLVAYFFGEHSVPEALVYALILSAFGLLFFALVAAFAYDLQRQPVHPEYVDY